MPKMNRWASILVGLGVLGAEQPRTPLELHKPLERVIQAGETHRYELTLRTGELVRGVVDQRGISINLKGYFPDGSKIRSFGGAAQGPKRFRFVAEPPGSYGLELRAPETGEPGSYRIEIEQIQALPDRLKIVREERYRSPRLDVLRRELEAGNEGALANLWQDVQQQGSPLVEPIEGDEQNLFVTFLWRATFETHNILVVWLPFSGNHPDDYQMARLGGTDLWYKTLRIRTGARFRYQLSPNDTLTRAENAQRYATAQLDPLNPRRYPEDPNLTKYEVSSIAELPGAAPQPWTERREGTPTGKVEPHRISSKLLGNDRSLSVYTPHGYSSDGKPYGLLVLFDESAYLTIGAAPTTLDNLIAAGRIPPLVAVLVGSIDQPTRGRELPCNPLFADFLRDELLPWVRRQYHVTSDPRHVTVGGASYGGLAAVFASFRHPESFGNVLCQSGSFWWAPAQKPDDLNVRDGEREPNWLARQFVRSAQQSTRFFLEAGLFENDISGGGGQILETSRHLRDVLRARGYEVHYQEFAGGHDFLNWRGSLADGLVALVGTTRAD